MIRTKKLGLVLLSLLAVLLMPLFATRYASAQLSGNGTVTARWIDRANIQITVTGYSYNDDGVNLPISTEASGIYFDQEHIDSDHQYVNTSQSDCRSDIRVNPDNPSSGTIWLNVVNPVNSDCIEVELNNINFTDQANANIWFYRTSSTTLQSLDGNGMEYGAIFTLNASTNTYISEYDEDGCRDYVTVSGATAVFHKLDKNRAEADCENRDPQDISVQIGDSPPSDLPGGGGGDDAVDEPSCETEGGGFSFIVCPLLRGANGLFQWLDERIVNSLNVNPEYLNDDGTVGAWANFRNIAYILLIPVMLLMIIGTALGFSFMDAYTVKRAMPRLLAAIIFIALSKEICLILVEISNAVGRGTAGLIATPFGGLDSLRLQDIFNDPGVGSDALFLGVAIAAGVGAFFAGVTFFSLLLTLGVAVLAMFLVFALLALREMLIVALTIVAPLAILVWIFPGNDKLWKLWWSAFSKMLWFFPIVIGIIVMGRAFASVVQAAGPDGSDAFISVLIKLIAFVGPYFFIPKAFQMAGGALGSLSGMVNDRSKGLFDRAKNARANSMKGARERNEQGNRFRNAPKGSFRERVNTAAMGGVALQKAGWRPGRVRAQQRLDQVDQIEDAGKDPGMGAVLANDDASQAALHGRGTLQGKIDYLVNEVGYQIDDATQIANELQLLEREHGADTVAAHAVVQLAGSKTAFRGGPAEMLNAIMDAAEGDTQLAATLYAKARGAAEGAGRLDLAGYSYGEGLVAMQQIATARDDIVVGRRTDGTVITAKDQIADEANSRLMDKVIDSKGVGAVISSHGTSVKNLAPIMRNRLENANIALRDAQASGDAAAISVAEDDRAAALAEISNAYDSIAHISPENAREFRDQVLTQSTSGWKQVTTKEPVFKPVEQADGRGGVTIVQVPVRDASGVQLEREVVKIVQHDGGPLAEGERLATVQEAMGAERENKKFQQTRREYGLSEEEIRRRGGLEGDRMPGI